MNITLGYARKVLARFADSGYCPEDPRVVDSINGAVQRLLIKAPADASCVRMRFCVTNGTITMPREVGKILKMTSCAKPRVIQNRWYEFLDGGPGSLDYSRSCVLSFVDQGDGFRTHSDIMVPKQIMVLCDTDEDPNARIIIRGMDEHGKEVMSSTGMGERIEFDPVNPRYTKSKFSSITSVVKPITNGYVYLATYEPDGSNDNIHQLATYHPYEERPSYRRYFVTGGHENYTMVTALAQLRFIPAMSDSDALLVQNIPALQSMMQAQSYYNAGDVSTGQEYEAMAVRYFIEQIEADNMGSTHIDFVDGFAPGDVAGVM